MKKIMVYVLYLLVVWGSFRYFFDFSDVVEELWFKPVIWLVPLFWWNISLKNRVKFFEGNGYLSLLWGVVAGAVYCLLVGEFSRFGNITLDILGIAMVTSMVEEMTFSGFVLGYLLQKKYSENLAIFTLGLVVMLTRLPILMFGFEIKGRELFFVSLFVFAIAIINGLIRVKTNNVLGSILARVAVNLVSMV